MRILTVIVSFNAYDKDGDGTISKDELAEMFKYAWMSGFKAMKSLSSEEITPQEIKEFCEQSAKAFADSVMEQMDTDGNGNFLSIDMKVFWLYTIGVLDFEEFKAFAMQQPVITATLSDFEQQVRIINIIETLNWVVSRLI